MADPAVIRALYSESVRAGIDPTLAVATSSVESGWNPRAIGDLGTSFGLFQLHRGGLLGSLTPTQAFDPLTNARRALGNMRAQAFKHRYTDAGKLAAESQRPADQAGYARKVNDRLDDADRVLSSFGLPTDLPQSGGTRPAPGVAGDVDPGSGNPGGSWWRNALVDGISAVPGGQIAGAALDVGLPFGIPNPANVITEPIERAGAYIGNAIAGPFVALWALLSDGDTWTRVALFVGGGAMILLGAFVVVRG